MDLLVTDGHDGLLAAIGELFAATPRQRCLVHKQRNVLSAIPRRERDEVQAELSGIWKQETKEEAFINLKAFKAKYAQRYPEAVRSLDVLCLSPCHASSYSDDQCHREPLQQCAPAHRPD